MWYITSGAHACGEEGHRPCDESQKGNLSREALSHLLKLVESRVHTSPQERERAEIEGFEISVAKTSFKANTKALAENEGEGLAKWVVQALNVDTGANHSAEGVKQPAFDKKQFVAFVKKYIKPLSATSGGSVGLMGLISQAVYDGGRHVLGVIPKTLMPRESSVLHSQPKSTVGTPAYIAPEVLLRQECDGKGIPGDVKCTASLEHPQKTAIILKVLKRELPKGKWFCCMDCNRVHSALQNLVVSGEQKLQDSLLSIIKKKLEEKGSESSANVDLADLRKFADNEELQSKWREAKRSNKMKVVSFLKEKTGYIVNPDAMFDVQVQMVSFVNSIATIKGGTHVDYVTNQITNYVMSIVNKKNKNANLKAHALKIHLWVFVNALIDNLAFDFQTKETLTIRQSSFGSKCELSQEFLKKDFKQSKDLKKTDGTKRQRITGITKLEDANDAGGKSSDKCTLILTEGVSAKALAMAGISVVGQNYYGVFPLRDKLLNVRESSHKQIMEKAEIQSIKQILGLQHGKQYDSVKTLRYGHLMIMTDQVKHSRTSSPSSYEKDFCELVDIYTRKKRPDKKKHNVMLQDLEHDSDSSSNTSNDSVFEADRMSPSFLDNIVDDSFSENDDDVSSSKANQSTASNEKKLSVEYLEDECDLLMGVDDLDVVDITNIDHASARYIYTRLLIMRVLAGLEGFLNKGSSADGSFVKPGTSQQNLSSFQSQAVQSEAGKNFTEMEGRCSSDLYRNTSEELFLTRKILTEKIAQLNSAIDDVSSQLRADDTPNGTAMSPDELEASI
ncbi:unnamed protein product [Camellia sinensis]